MRTVSKSPRALATAALILTVVTLATPTTARAQEPGRPHPTFEPTDCWFDAAAIEAGAIRCGYVPVPENRAQPDGRMIRLAVAVAEPVEATASGLPVALLPGGPGMTVLRGGRGISLLRGWVGDRTVVVFDIRGTGETGPLMCPALSITERDIASMDLSLEEANTLERGAYLACRDELMNEGIDPAAYHGGSIAEDVRDIREALGYSRWDLFGGSYGSWIARRVLREDPQGIRSATIMSGPPPDPTQLLTRDIPFFHRALENVFSRCDADPSCTSRYPKIEQVFYETHQQLLRDPWTVPVDQGRFRRPHFTINGQDFIRMIYSLLADSDLFHLPALVAAFHDPDENVVRQIVERQYGGLSSTFSTGMMYSVECYESHTPESRAERERLAAPYPAALLEIRYFLAPCEDLHPARASAEERVLVRSETPTLIISAELDAMGPAEVGEEIHRLLPNSFHVVFPGASHFFAFNPLYQSCVKEIITDFFGDPATPPAGSCLEELPEREISTELPAWAGVEAAHQRFGRLPFAAVFEPAIHFAEAGFELPAFLAGVVQRSRPFLERLPETKEVFTGDDGRHAAAADRFPADAWDPAARADALGGHALGRVGRDPRSGRPYPARKRARRPHGCRGRRG